MKQYLVIGLSSLLSALIAVAAYRYFEPQKEVVIRETVSARYTNFDQMGVSKQRQFLSSSPTHFTAAADHVIPAVVNIKTTQGGGFELWGGSGVGSASGSGVLISDEGYIITNNHVIEDSDEIEVTLNDKREFKAELIGTDPSTDLALVKIEGEGLPTLEFGNSDSLRVGEWVLAIGNPFNLESTVTTGIVSAKGRSIDILEGQDRIESFIQTDAAVNPGNSGGALVNTNGELVGINTAIITRSGRYEGYSFAVPINLVRKVVRDLREYGMVQRGILGVFIDEMTNKRADELGLSAVEGVYINRVTPGSGADDADLQKGDVIMGINGIKTKTLPEMQEQLGRYRPGNAVRVDIFRQGKRREVEVILKNKSNSTALVTGKNEDILLDVGFELRELTRLEKRRLQVEGVKVISIYRGSRIERTNMDPEFIITKIDNKPVREVSDAIRYLEASSGKVMLEGVYEHYPGEYYYAFAMD